jgi:2,4-dienoyl-CoA reductase-like NADH-dependent reductase (Old Yellow Enzyme family)
MLLEVTEAVRSAVGTDFPVLVKINSEDSVDGGLTVDESIAICAMLQDAGVQAVELSGGTAFGVIAGDYEITFSPINKDGAYWRNAAAELKQKVTIPVMLVGGIRTYDTAENLVESGAADYISLSRPLIREPDLIARWESGDRRKAACVSDNGCMQPTEGRTDLHCIHVA